MKGRFFSVDYFEQHVQSLRYHRNQVGFIPLEGVVDEFEDGYDESTGLSSFLRNVGEYSVSEGGLQKKRVPTNFEDVIVKMYEDIEREERSEIPPRDIYSNLLPKGEFEEKKEVIFDLEEFNTIYFHDPDGSQFREFVFKDVEMEKKPSQLIFPKVELDEETKIEEMYIDPDNDIELTFLGRDFKVSKNYEEENEKEEISRKSSLVFEPPIFVDEDEEEISEERERVQDEDDDIEEEIRIKAKMAKTSAPKLGLYKDVLSSSLERNDDFIKKHKENLMKEEFTTTKNSPDPRYPFSDPSASSEGDNCERIILNNVISSFKYRTILKNIENEEKKSIGLENRKKDGRSKVSQDMKMLQKDEDIHKFATNNVFQNGSGNFQPVEIPLILEDDDGEDSDDENEMIGRSGPRLSFFDQERAQMMKKWGDGRKEPRTPETQKSSKKKKKKDEVYPRRRRMDGMGTPITHLSRSRIQELERKIKKKEEEEDELYSGGSSEDDNGWFTERPWTVRPIPLPGEGGQKVKKKKDGKEEENKKELYTLNEFVLKPWKNRDSGNERMKEETQLRTSIDYSILKNKKPVISKLELTMTSFFAFSRDPFIDCFSVQKHSIKSSSSEDDVFEKETKQLMKREEKYDVLEKEEIKNESPRGNREYKIPEPSTPMMTQSTKIRMLNIPSGLPPSKMLDEEEMEEEMKKKEGGEGTKRKEERKEEKTRPKTHHILHIPQQDTGRRMGGGGEEDKMKMLNKKKKKKKKKKRKKYSKRERKIVNEIRLNLEPLTTTKDEEFIANLEADSNIVETLNREYQDGGVGVFHHYRSSLEFLPGYQQFKTIEHSTEDSGSNVNNIVINQQQQQEEEEEEKIVVSDFMNEIIGGNERIIQLSRVWMSSRKCMCVLPPHTNILYSFIIYLQNLMIQKRRDNNNNNSNRNKKNIIRIVFHTTTRSSETPGERIFYDLFHTKMVDYYALVSSYFKEEEEFRRRKQEEVENIKCYLLESESSIQKLFQEGETGFRILFMPNEMSEVYDEAMKKNEQRTNPLKPTTALFKDQENAMIVFTPRYSLKQLSECQQRYERMLVTTSSVTDFTSEGGNLDLPLDEVGLVVPKFLFPRRAASTTSVSIFEPSIEHLLSYYPYFEIPFSDQQKEEKKNVCDEILEKMEMLKSSFYRLFENLVTSSREEMIKREIRVLQRVEDVYGSDNNSSKFIDREISKFAEFPASVVSNSKRVYGSLFNMQLLQTLQEEMVNGTSSSTRYYINSIETHPTEKETFNALIHPALKKMFEFVLTKLSVPKEGGVVGDGQNQLQQTPQKAGNQNEQKLIVLPKQRVLYRMLQQPQIWEISTPCVLIVTRYSTSTVDIITHSHTNKDDNNNNIEYWGLVKNDDGNYVIIDHTIKNVNTSFDLFFRSFTETTTNRRLVFVVDSESLAQVKKHFGLFKLVVLFRCDPISEVFSGLVKKIVVRINGVLTKEKSQVHDVFNSSQEWMEGFLKQPNIRTSDNYVTLMVKGKTELQEEPPKTTTFIDLTTPADEVEVVNDDGKMKKKMVDEDDEDDEVIIISDSIKKKKKKMKANTQKKKKKKKKKLIIEEEDDDDESSNIGDFLSGRKNVISFESQKNTRFIPQQPQQQQPQLPQNILNKKAKKTKKKKKERKKKEGKTKTIFVSSNLIVNSGELISLLYSQYKEKIVIREREWDLPVDVIVSPSECIGIVPLHNILEEEKEFARKECMNNNNNNNNSINQQKLFKKKRTQFCHESILQWMENLTNLTLCFDKVVIIFQFSKTKIVGSRQQQQQQQQQQQEDRGFYSDLEAMNRYVTSFMGFSGLLKKIKVYIRYSFSEEQTSKIVGQISLASQSSESQGKIETALTARPNMFLEDEEDEDDSDDSSSDTDVDEEESLEERFLSSYPYFHSFTARVILGMISIPKLAPSRKGTLSIGQLILLPRQSLFKRFEKIGIPEKCLNGFFQINHSEMFSSSSSSSNHQQQLQQQQQQQQQNMNDPNGMVDEGAYNDQIPMSSTNQQYLLLDPQKKNILPPLPPTPPPKKKKFKGLDPEEIENEAKKMSLINGLPKAKRRKKSIDDINNNDGGQLQMKPRMIIGGGNNNEYMSSPDLLNFEPVMKKRKTMVFNNNNHHQPQQQQPQFFGQPSPPPVQQLQHQSIFLSPLRQRNQLRQQPITSFLGRQKKKPLQQRDEDEDDDDGDSSSSDDDSSSSDDSDSSSDEDQKKKKKKKRRKKKKKKSSSRRRSNKNMIKSFMNDNTRTPPFQQQQQQQQRISPYYPQQQQLFSPPNNSMRRRSNPQFVPQMRPRGRGGGGGGSYVQHLLQKLTNPQQQTQQPQRGYNNIGSPPMMMNRYPHPSQQFNYYPQQQQQMYNPQQQMMMMQIQEENVSPNLKTISFTSSSKKKKKSLRDRNGLQNPLMNDSSSSSERTTIVDLQRFAFDPSKSEERRRQKKKKMKKMKKKKKRTKRK